MGRALIENEEKLKNEKKCGKMLLGALKGDGDVLNGDGEVLNGN